MHVSPASLANDRDALAVLKHERRRGASAKSDDVIAMLEEETEALVSAHYQAPRNLGHDD